MHSHIRGQNTVDNQLSHELIIVSGEVFEDIGSALIENLERGGRVVVFKDLWKSL